MSEAVACAEGNIIQDKQHSRSHECAHPNVGPCAPVYCRPESPETNKVAPQDNANRKAHSCALWCGSLLISLHAWAVTNLKFRIGDAEKDCIYASLHPYSGMQITEQIKAKEEKKGVWYQLLPRTTLFDSDASPSTFLLNSRVELVYWMKSRTVHPKENSGRTLVLSVIHKYRA